MPAWTWLPPACTALLVLVACGRVDEPSRDAVGAFDDLPPGWTALPDPPEVRIRGAMSWTGGELLVWGGFEFTGYSDESAQGDGFAFSAATRTWQPLSDSPLTPRAYVASAWSGEELLVWGGSDRRQERFFDDGAAYDPELDAWRALAPAPIGARAGLSVWTGEELLVWGTALRMHPRPQDGAAYDPRSDSWRTIADAPIELTDATAVWTGEEMIVFGAALHGGNFPETKTAIGAAYDPETDAWRRLPDSALSPQASTAAWTGRELVAWDYLNGTAAYEPRENRWRALDDVPLDSGECSPESVAMGGTVLGNYCGQLTRYDETTDEWSDIAGHEHVHWNFELVAADPVFLLLGRNAETDGRQILAYRPG
jgi:hypothetical protein